MTKLYSVAEAAAYLGVARTTIRRWVDSGKLRPSHAEHRRKYVAFWFNRAVLDNVDHTKPEPTVIEPSPMTSVNDQLTLRGYRRWVEARQQRLERRALQSAGGGSTTR